MGRRRTRSPDKTWLPSSGCWPRSKESLFDTIGFGRFPSRHFAINGARLQLALTGIDLLAWTRILLLGGDLAIAEPK